MREATLTLAILANSIFSGTASSNKICGSFLPLLLILILQKGPAGNYIGIGNEEGVLKRKTQDFRVMGVSYQGALRAWPGGQGSPRDGVKWPVSLLKIS